MKHEIEYERLEEFAVALARLRREFPEFAREIDRCQFDVGRRHLGSCGHGGCDCQMSFEEFHAHRRRVFRTNGAAQTGTRKIF